MSNMIEKKKVNLFTKIAVIFLAAILFFCLILGCAVGYFRLTVAHYYQASEKAFVFPALNDGYVPQGFCYDSETDKFLLSGYMKDNSRSPLHFVNKASGECEKTLFLKLSDGSDYVGHGSSVTFWKNYVYLSDGDTHAVHVFNYAELKNATAGSTVTSIGSFLTETSEDDYVKPSFVEVNGDTLVIGEFFREGIYDTLDSHKITTPNGDKNYALAIEFSLQDDFEFGINPELKKAYSMRRQVQGITFTEDKILISSSWGLSFSHIMAYDIEKATKGTIHLLGKDVPLYYLDSANLAVDIEIAPMSEEMAIVDGKLYVSCESASTKYIFGKFTGGKWCYATDLSKYGI